MPGSAFGVFHHCVMSLFVGHWCPSTHNTRKHGNDTGTCFNIGVSCANFNSVYTEFSFVENMERSTAFSSCQHYSCTCIFLSKFILFQLRQKTIPQLSVCSLLVLGWTELLNWPKDKQEQLFHTNDQLCSLKIWWG